MLSVDHTLVSDDLVDARFACDLGACKGACCLVGDAGAPVLDDERERLDAAVPLVLPLLTDEARRVIADRGAWEETAPGVYNTACVNGPAGPGACVFVAYERGVALCSIEKLYHAGQTDWPKPISCALYPLRVQTLGHGDDALDLVNYEQIDLCDPARRRGQRENVRLSDFLEGPLARAYGQAWLTRLQTALAQRRNALGQEERA
ncbi:MAG: DUF3109 family protein [Rhodothermales bacterium]|nr:DUF3109 family protein [Rhodothermales bacterium]MCA0269854.1 DUF3109 family protein [Bacteroidota bacterium]